MDPIRGRTFDNDSGVKICKNIDREPRGAIDVAFVTEPSQAAAREPDEQIICLKVERNVTRERERERERGGEGEETGREAAASISGSDRKRFLARYPRRLKRLVEVLLIDRK